MVKERDERRIIPFPTRPPGPSEPVHYVGIAVIDFAQRKAGDEFYLSTARGFGYRLTITNTRAYTATLVACTHKGPFVEREITVRDGKIHTGRKLAYVFGGALEHTADDITFIYLLL